MYKIIGADQKEYGPVTAEELRQWIVQGRANGQTPIKAEGSTEWRPLSMFAEFASSVSASGAGPIPPLPVVDYGALPADIETRDYDLDIGRCIGNAWSLLRANFWPVVGFSLLVSLAMGGLNQVFSLISRGAVNSMVASQTVSVPGILLVLLTIFLSMPIQTIFMGGMYRYYLKLIRGQDATIGDAFSGFSVGFGQLALLGLVKGLLEMLAIAACVVPGIYLGVAWVFATMLVVDKSLGFWDALELSRKVVTRHWFIVFALLIVVALLSIAGMIACCIGLFVTVPLGWLALACAYEDIFGHRQT